MTNCSPIKLTKLSDNINAVRTKEIIGTTPFELDKLVVGDFFVMFAEPLDETKNYRQVTTSKIVSLERSEDSKTVVINTLNSVYKIQKLEEE